MILILTKIYIKLQMRNFCPGGKRSRHPPAHSDVKRMKSISGKYWIRFLKSGTLLTSASPRRARPRAGCSVMGLGEGRERRPPVPRTSGSLMGHLPVTPAGRVLMESERQERSCPQSTLCFQEAA